MKSIIFTLILNFIFILPNIACSYNPASLTCYNGLNISLGVNNSPIQIWPTDMLPGNQGSNADFELVILDTNGDTVPNNLITSAYLGQTLIGYVTEISSGDSCWGSIIVEACANPFYICDTECRSAPFGDCASGHSLDDGVEWPCDLDISVCSFDQTIPSALISNNLADPADAEPSINNNCPGISISTTFADQVFILSDSVQKTIRTWTILDWNSSNIYQYDQVIIATLNDCNGACVDDVTPPVAICDVFLYLSLGNDGTATIYPSMIDDGSYDLCRIDTMTLSQTEFTCADVGQTIPVTLTVYDEAGNSSSCITDVMVQGNNNGNVTCIDAISIALDIDDQVTFYPGDFTIGNGGNCASLNLELVDVDDNIIPNNVVDASYWGDTLFAFVSEIPSGQTCWSTVYVLEDTCNVVFTICDTECNGAPLGGCASGHTDSDDVEWPCDISVNACHSDLLSPSSLMSNFGISSENAEPQLFNSSCGLIAVTYEDLVFISGDSLFTIYREWTIIDWTQSQGSIPFTFWNYTQTIYANTAGCTSSTYCVNTLNDRNLAEVVIDDLYITGDYGCSEIPDFNPNPTLFKADDIQNGVDIFDYLLIREWVLGITTFSDDQLIASDFNRDGYTSTLDLVYIYKTILGEPVNVDSLHWQFFYDGEDPLQTGHIYRALKRGDVNDDAITGASDDLTGPVVHMEIKDIILNLGETYMVPINAQDFQNIQGGHFQFEYDSDAVEILSVESPVLKDFSEDDYNITQDRVFMNWVVSDENFQLGQNVNSNQEIFYVHFKSLKNTIASKAFTFVSKDRSKMAKPLDKNRYSIVYNWDKQLNTKTKDNLGSHYTLNLFPNPADQYIQIAMPTLMEGNLQVQIKDIQGRTIYSGTFPQSMKLSTQAFNIGLHFISIFNEQGQFLTDKFVIAR